MCSKFVGALITSRALVDLRRSVRGFVRGFESAPALQYEVCTVVTMREEHEMPTARRGCAPRKTRCSPRTCTHRSIQHWWGVYAKGCKPLAELRKIDRWARQGRAFEAVAARGVGEGAVLVIEYYILYRTKSSGSRLRHMCLSLHGIRTHKRKNAVYVPPNSAHWR